MQILVPTINYPIAATADESHQMDEYVRIIRTENERHARGVWRDCFSILTSHTRTRRVFGLWKYESNVFDHCSDTHILKSVLLVAWRFQWPPEEILALWQIEGLPVSAPLEKEGLNWDPDPIKEYGLPNPRCKAEALAMARSIVLYDRWGLDKLTPHRFSSRQRDNILVPTQERKTHDDAFKKGFNTEIAPVLSSSPIEYFYRNLDTGDGPIRVKRSRYSGLWLYAVHSEYQTAMLAMQYARFINLRRIIEEEYMPSDIRLPRCQGCNVRLDLGFPAFIRTFYNCPSDSGRKKLIRAMARLARNSLPQKSATCRRTAPGQFTREELHELFTGRPVPWPISRNVRSFPPTGVGACYVGGLRFEVLRVTYKMLFANTIPGTGQ